MFAVVCKSLAPIMSQPTRECELADEALYGMVVEILEDFGNWVRIMTHYRYEGYVEKLCLCMDAAHVQQWQALPKMVVQKGHVDLLNEPKVQGYNLASLTRGGLLAQVVPCEENGWVQVTLACGETGYTRESFLMEYITDFDKADEYALRDQFVENALMYLGTHYRWGGKSPLGIDCSGLCAMAYLLAGVVIYRDAHIKDGFAMHKIEYSSIKKGDLIFFPGHVGMYIGEGKFIHSTARKGDDGVVIASLREGDLDFRADLLAMITECGSVF